MHGPGVLCLCLCLRALAALAPPWPVLRSCVSRSPSHSLLSPFMTSPVPLVQSASILPRVASASLPLTPVCLYMGCPAHAYPVSQAELPLPAWPYTSDPVPRSSCLKLISGFHSPSSCLGAPAAHRALWGSKADTEDTGLLTSWGTIQSHPG